MSDETTPNLVEAAFRPIDDASLLTPAGEAPIRILLLYGSLRERSYSKLTALEGARMLRRLGADTRVFDPSGLPLPDDAEADHPKVA